MGVGTRGVRAGLLGVAVASVTLSPPLVGDGARAQTKEETAQATGTLGRQRSFDIPAQPLAGALAAFGQQSGMQVSVSADVAQGVASRGVSGTMTPIEALDRLLAGTGIV